jgi:DNA primase
MAFAPHFLDELRARISLASVVGRRVRLQRRGREYVGLCPFHKEKTPSFNVVEDKGFYHCFGCGAHGDVIGFIMRDANLSFREAVEQLAKEAGLAVPKETAHEREREAQAASLYEVCETACQHFEAQLTTARGAGAKSYLSGRGVTADLIRRFRLGYAPSGNTLLQALKGRFSEKLLQEAGLVRSGDDGHSFDFFRDRVVFPIADRQGRIVAFGGRTLGDGQPKYLNSSDTPIFQKGRLLYALHTARTTVSPDSPPIVAEGYMDVVALHGAGFTTAVAPLGTALTEHQLVELWKLSQEPVLCFDGDAAGYRAADRAVTRALPLIREGLALQIVTLPAGEDPDSLIQSGGPSQFQLILRSSKSISEYLWQAATRGRDFSTPEKVLQLEHTLLQKVLLIEDRKSQTFFRRYINDKVWDTYQSARRSRKGKREPALGSEVEQGLRPEAVREKIEMVILARALSHPEFVRADIDQFARISPNRRELREIHYKILELIAHDPDVSASQLEDRLVDAGLAKHLNRIVSSAIYAAQRLGRSGVDEDEARIGWIAALSRYLLPEVRKDLDEAVGRWVVDSSEENQDTMLMYRQLWEDQNTEAALIRARWDSIERVGEWHPAVA